MKKILIILGLCFAILAVTACTDIQSNSQQETSSEGVGLEDNDVEYITALKAEPQNIQFGVAEDTQAYTTTIIPHDLAYYNGGYYFMTEEGTSDRILSYFDPETGLCTPVCAQPQCDHTTLECTAIYSGYASTVWCYKEKLYFVRFGDNGKSVLVEGKLDGTGRKDLFEIGNNPQDLKDSYNLAFAQDCVFIYNRTGNYAYITDESMKISIRMRSLDGKLDKEIAVSYESGSAFEMLKSYKGNLFFVYTHTVIDEKTYVHTVTSEGLYCYDIANDEMHKVIDDAVYDFSMDDTNNVLYYFVMGEGIYSYDFNTDVTKKIYESDSSTYMCTMSYDGKYIYLDNSRYLSFSMDRTAKEKVFVIDTDGDLLNTIESTIGTAVYFGDSKYLLHSASNDDENRYADGKRYFHRMSAIKYIDKSEILTADSWKQSVWND